MQTAISISGIAPGDEIFTRSCSILLLLLISLKLIVSGRRQSIYWKLSVASHLIRRKFYISTFADQQYIFILYYVEFSDLICNLRAWHMDLVIVNPNNWTHKICCLVTLVFWWHFFIEATSNLKFIDSHTLDIKSVFKRLNKYTIHLTQMSFWH